MDKKKKKSSPRNSSSILPRSPIVYEEYKSWCSWGLIGLFRFKQDQYNKSKISGKARGNRRAVGNGNAKSKLDLVPRFREKCHRTHNVAEEIKTKKVSFTRLHKVKSDSRPVGASSKGERKINKPCKKAVSSDCKQTYEPITAEKSGNVTSEAQQKVEDDKASFRCLGDYRSKHFSYALDILRSNRELFIELLQDPTSLSEKHTQDSWNSQQESLQSRSFFEAVLMETQLKKQRHELDEQTHNLELEQNLVLKPGLTSQRLKDMKKKPEHVIRVDKDDFQFPSNDCTPNESLSSGLTSNDGWDEEESEITSKNLSTRSHIDVRQVWNSSQEIKSTKDTSHMINSQEASQEGGSSSVTSRESLENNAASSCKASGSSIGEHVNKLLEATGTECNRIHTRFTFPSHPSLEQPLLDELIVNTWRNQSIGNHHKLSSSYTYEVAGEIYGRCIKSYRCVTVMNHGELPLELMKESVKRLDERSVSEEQPPQSNLNRLMEKDVAGNWSWLDLRSEMDDVTAEIVELFLQDLVTEMINELKT